MFVIWTQLTGDIRYVRLSRIMPLTTCPRVDAFRDVLALYRHWQQNDMVPLKQLNEIALLNKSSLSYEVSLAIYGITQCYLPPDTSERAPPNPSQTGWYSINLPRRDGRLS